MRTGIDAERYVRRWMADMKSMKTDGRWPEVQACWRRSLLVGLLSGFCGCAMVVFCTGCLHAEEPDVGFLLTMGAIGGLCLVWLPYMYLTWMLVSARRQKGYAWCKGPWPLAMRIYDIVSLSVGLAIGVIVL